jgi:hypothetical protein
MSKASVCGAEFVVCDAYQDQGHYIGDDPVGCGCARPAETTIRIDGKLIDMCMYHRQMLDEEPERISFRGTSDGK